MSIYHQDTTIEQITLSQAEMPVNASKQINQIIIEKLARDLEGVCNSRGLIKPGSINLLKRSSGIIYPNNFKGDFHFQVKISYQVCNPREGMNIQCQVYDINKMGIIAGIGPDLTKSPVMVMIPRFQHHLDMDQYKEIQIGDTVTIEVADKKFELGDSRIVVMALLKDNKSKHVVGGGDDELFSDDNNISVVDIQRQEKLYSIINHTITNDTDLDSLVTDLPVRPMIEALQEQYSSDEWKKLSLDEKNRLIVNIQKELEQLENNDGMDNLFENAEGLGEGLGEEEEPGEEEPGEQEIEFN